MKKMPAPGTLEQVRIREALEDIRKECMKSATITGSKNEEDGSKSLSEDESELSGELFDRIPRDMNPGLRVALIKKQLSQRKDLTKKQRRAL